MKFLRGINLSLAAFVAICFFLPWVQVSCGGVHDTESGLDLARRGTPMLGLVPLAMLIVFALGLGRDWQRRVLSFGLASVIGGIASALMIFRQRVDSGQVAGLLAASMTVWFWLSFVAAAAIAIIGLLLIVRRPPKAPIGS